MIPKNNLFYAAEHKTKMKKIMKIHNFNEKKWKVLRILIGASWLCACFCSGYLMTDDVEE